MTGDLKGAGYLVSAGSVLLLGAVSWSSASRQPWLLAALVAGMALSIVGMALRWISHRHDRRLGNISNRGRDEPR